MSADGLRPPLPLDPAAAAYKEWLHLNLLDHRSGAIGLVNVSLHGSPDDPRSRSVGAALVHLPDDGWIGNTEVLGLAEAGVGAASIALEGVAIAVTRLQGDVLASAQFARDGLVLEVTASPIAPAIDVERRLPLGHGWISWYAVPSLHARGTLTAGGEPVDLGEAVAYHDHNWGRWHWGDDLGWEWGCFLAPADGPVFVVSRTTNRAHTVSDRPLVVAQVGRSRRSFAGASVELHYEGRLEVRLRRLPGAMAALHQDRATPRLPSALTVTADDGVDRVELRFHPRAAAQLVAADPAARGYGFVHELVGEFDFDYSLAGEASAGSGLAVVEYVD